MNDLLDREHEAILDGDLERVVRLVNDKEALFSKLVPSLWNDSRDIERLREKTERNQILLRCAMDGIRTVADRLSDLRRTRDTLETYDKSGRKTSINSPHIRHVEKRA